MLRQSSGNKQPKGKPGICAKQTPCPHYCHSWVTRAKYVFKVKTP